MDWSYLAGFFDGEGYAFFQFDGRRYGVAVSGHMGFGSSSALQREHVIKFLRENGVRALSNTFNTPNSLVGLQTSCISINWQDDVEKLAQKLLPFVVLKRRTLELLLLGYELRKHGDVTAFIPQWEALRMEMKSLNTKGRKVLKPVSFYQPDPIGESILVDNFINRRLHAIYRKRA